MKITPDPNFSGTIDIAGIQVPVFRFIQEEAGKHPEVFYATGIPLTLLVSTEIGVGASAYQIYSEGMNKGLSPIAVGGEALYFLPLIMSATGATVLIDQGSNSYQKMGSHILSGGSSLFFKEGQEEDRFCFRVPAGLVLEKASE